MFWKLDLEAFSILALLFIKNKDQASGLDDSSGSSGKHRVYQRSQVQRQDLSKDRAWSGIRKIPQFCSQKVRPSSCSGERTRGANVNKFQGGRVAEHQVLVG